MEKDGKKFLEGGKNFLKGIGGKTANFVKGQKKILLTLLTGAVFFASCGESIVCKDKKGNYLKLRVDKEIAKTLKEGDSVNVAKIVNFQDKNRNKELNGNEEIEDISYELNTGYSKGDVIDSEGNYGLTKVTDIELMPVVSDSEGTNSDKN